LYITVGNPFQRSHFHDDGHAALALLGLHFSPRRTSMPSPTIAARTISGSKTRAVVSRSGSIHLRRRLGEGGREEASTTDFADYTDESRAVRINSTSVPSGHPWFKSFGCGSVAPRSVAENELEPDCRTITLECTQVSPTFSSG